MTIPLTIEATEPTGLALCNSGVSLVTLESVLSASSFRFHHEEETKFGRKLSEGPIAKPLRKRSTNHLIFFHEDDGSNRHNATFAEEDADTGSIGSSSSRGPHHDRSRSRSRPSKASPRDHLIERYMKLLENAKEQEAHKIPPQQPRRKSSTVRLASSSKPLSMPLRKPSIGNFQGHRRRGSA